MVSTVLCSISNRDHLLKYALILYKHFQEWQHCICLSFEFQTGSFPSNSMWLNRFDNFSIQAFSSDQIIAKNGCDFKEVNKMSRKYGICCATCNVLLNNEDEIFGTSCGHLYHFLCIIGTYGQSGECMHCDSYKPMLYKMHLKFEDCRLSEKDQEKNIELCTKLKEYERNNAFLNSSNNAARQSVQEHEAKIKVLKDALQAKEDVVKQLTDRIETLEILNEYLTSNASKTPDVGNASRNKIEGNNTMNVNNKKQQPNKYSNTKKTSYKGKGGNSNENIANKEESTSNDNNKDIKTYERNSSDDDIENVASGGSKEQATPNEKPEISDKTKVGNTVMIKNFKSSDLNKDSAIANVIALAEQMGLSLTHNQIKDLYVFRENEHFLTYVVEFYTKNMRDAFLGKKHVLKKFPNTKFLFIF